MPLRIAIFEDDSRYRGHLETLFRHTPDMEPFVSYGLLGPGLAADKSAWDLVLMDLELPDGSGIDAIAAIKAKHPGLPIVALTVFEEPAIVMQAIYAGADGYLLKRTPVATLLSALRSVVAGGSPLTPEIATHVLSLVRKGSGSAPQPKRLELTEREQEVLRALSAGAPYKEVGERLGISVDTVRSHIRALYKKLQVHSAAQAVGRAVREGLV